MKCIDVENILYDYVSGRIENDKREVLEAHLRECQACKIRSDIVRETIPVLNHWAPPELPRDFADRILEKIYPREKTWWQNFKDKLFFPRQWKAVALTAVVCLIVLVYTYEFGPKVDKIPRQVTIETEIAPAKNPIIIDTEENIDSAFARLKELMKAHNGNLIRRRPVEAGLEVSVGIEQEREETFLQDLSEFGKVEIKEGYKDSDGNIVIILRNS